MISLCLALSVMAAAPPTLAVSYFDNTSKVPELEPLKKGLADMLITDLVNVKGLRVVEREKLELVLKELSLSKTPFIDPKSAQQLGHGLSAGYVVTGAYLVDGEALRIDARIINVATGDLLAGDKVEGKRADLFDMEKDLAELIIRSLRVSLGFEERKDLRRLPTRSFEAFSRYAQGLDARDRGDAARAAEAFRAAVLADPEFRAAQRSLERLAVVEKHVETARATDFDALFAALDPADPAVAQRLHRLVELGGFEFTPQSIHRRIQLLDFVLRNDLRPVDSTGPVPFALEPALFFNTFPITSDRALSAHAAQVFEYFLLRYPDELYTRSWHTTWKAMQGTAGGLDTTPELRAEGLRTIGVLEAKLKKLRTAAPRE